MIRTFVEYERAQEELRFLVNWLANLQRDYSLSKKGLTKAGVCKLIARLHEELGDFEGSKEARHPPGDAGET